MWFPYLVMEVAERPFSVLYPFLNHFLYLKIINKHCCFTIIPKGLMKNTDIYTSIFRHTILHILY